MVATPNYDPRAMAVAQVIGDVIRPDDIFLFGSRARGDWRDDSDIDVFTIAESDADTKDAYRRALQAGKDKALAVYSEGDAIDCCSSEDKPVAMDCSILPAVQVAT